MFSKDVHASHVNHIQWIQSSARLSSSRTCTFCKCSAETPERTLHSLIHFALRTFENLHFLHMLCKTCDISV